VCVFLWEVVFAKTGYQISSQHGIEMIVFCTMLSVAGVVLCLIAEFCALCCAEVLSFVLR